MSLLPIDISESEHFGENLDLKNIINQEFGMKIIEIAYPSQDDIYYF